MAITAKSRMSNIKSSIEKYIHENLVVTEGLVVDFEEVPFESGHQLEWVEERIIGTGDFDFHRQVGGGADLGQTKELLLQFNVYTHRDNTTKVVRHYELRDIVYNYFTIGKEIPIYDYNNDEFNTVLDYLKVYEVDNDTAIPNTEWRQYNITFILLYTESWTK